MPSFVNLLRPPDTVTVVTEETVATLVADNGTFTGIREGALGVGNGTQ